jgi:hypothetical protein
LDLTAPHRWIFDFDHRAPRSWISQLLTAPHSWIF